MGEREFERSYHERRTGGLLPQSMRKNYDIEAVPIGSQITNLQQQRHFCVSEVIEL